MIPDFPTFKKIELSDQADIEAFTVQHPPYSDYNFTNLWCWDTAGHARISQLHQNLVIQFPDYITNELFYSFLGKNRVYDTSRVLLAHATKHGLTKDLKLIPESTIAVLNQVPHQWLVKEDVDNHDYILSADEHTTLLGKKYHKRRNRVRYFERKQGTKIRILPIDITRRDEQRQIEELFYRWQKSQQKEETGTKDELRALKKLLVNAHSPGLHSLGIFINGRLAAFAITEITHNIFGVIHFEKADTSYTGIFEYLHQQTAKYLCEKGCKYINYEQDLGIEGMRKAKLLHRPVSFLKKYTICEADKESG